MHISLLEQPLNTNTEFLVIFNSNPQYTSFLVDDEQTVSERQFKNDKSIVLIHRPKGIICLIKVDDTKSETEWYRQKGYETAKLANSEKTALITIDGSGISDKQIFGFVEGFALSGYRFNKYFKDSEKEKKRFIPQQIDVFHSRLTSNQMLGLNNLIKAIFWTRDMVNEPVSLMNAVRFSQEVRLRSQEAGLEVEVFDKKQIEALKMGGLLAVNRGSIDAPTFTICHWKPENAINKKPFVLVGKGVMYDTGGLSLKPTPNSMDTMKCDMAGAATVASTLYALALNNVPVWVIGLMPATDNRPGGNAYTPGDIIEMYNGLHVEIMNTDAEGRLILADALSYADKFEPDHIINLATLTGNAVMAIGSKAAVVMGNAPEQTLSKLIDAGTETFERLVPFPFWSDYAEGLKSPIADLKNLGGKEAGAIAAGKFLEYFTKSPFIHIDIAGPAFLTSENGYQGNGATAFGVRLLYQYFKEMVD